MYRTLGAMSLVLLTTSVLAQQTGLTEAMAIQMGLSRDAVQLMEEASVNQAQSEVLAARSRPNPEFHFERETLDNADDFVSQTFSISQQFDFSGRRNLHEQAADRHLDAVRQQSSAWRAELTREIRERYYIALLQQQRRNIFSKTEQRISVLSQALMKRRQEGDVSIYDDQRVITERATLAAEVRNVEVDLYTARQQLSALLGRSLDDDQMLAAVLMPDAVVPIEPLQAAIENQPALLQLHQQADAFDMQQRAESRSFPEITLGLGLKREENNNQTDDGLVLNASIPIPIFDTRKSGQAHYQAQAQMARSKYRLALDDAQAELAGLWRQASQYRLSARTFRDDAVMSAEKLIDIAEAYYRAGEIGILELLDAYRGVLNAELAALELEYKARQARIKLDHLTGGSIQ